MEDKAGTLKDQIKEIFRKSKKNSRRMEAKLVQNFRS